MIKVLGVKYVLLWFGRVREGRVGVAGGVGGGGFFVELSMGER